MLKLTTQELAHLAQNADKLYRIGKREKKKDGTTRLCFDALGPLNSAQARIQCLILNKVTYPEYLQGSIKDKASPRGQAANARLHTNQKTIITLDITQFFPSVSHAIVFDIWHRFFRCPPSVATCLTKLTTKEGALPQGTKTSNLLANLVFWEEEWQLAAQLHANNIRYTRLTDDITCSSHRPMTTHEKTTCIAAIRAMCLRKRLRLNRKKQTIANAATRMVTTKLVVNTKTSLTRQQRAAIRSAVNTLSNVPPEQRSTAHYQRQYSRASGRVAYLKQHHPHEAAELRTTLRHTRPIRQD
ncbi:MAG: reverse transcriptase family protein [Acidobacteriia bacterium]|nr:reverse transcriptase family protein [Terriglobia bacterium]